MYMYYSSVNRKLEQHVECVHLYVVVIHGIIASDNFICYTILAGVINLPEM